MIVVDTNVIAYLYLEGEYSQNVEALLKYDSFWSAPFLWRSEFRNVLAFYLRKKIIAYRDMLKTMVQAEDLLKGNEYEVSSESILDLAHHSNCSAYDCEFVSLAHKLAVPLVTADKKILAEFPDICVPLTKFT